ncbi:matrix-remodeling-associated protein 7 isoform 2-T2 [Polymixia lowei]
MDLTFILSAIIFTLLAIVVATSIFNGSSSSADFARGCFGQTGEAKAGGLNSSDLKQNCHLPGEKKAVEDWGEVSGSSHDHWDVVKSVLSTEGAAESPGINDKVEANANNSLKYVPGVMRTNHMQMMMSKDELEQEQRVQREQLAAIFQLLKQNKETFGEVSEGDIEEQLKLYSI